MTNAVTTARQRLREAQAGLEKALREDRKGTCVGKSFWWKQAEEATSKTWKRVYTAYAKCEDAGGHDMKPMIHSMSGSFAGMRCAKCGYSEYV